jgi:hypothetical protein
MLNKIIFIGFAGFSLMACSGNTANVNTTNANSATTNGANTAANAPANTAVNKPAATTAAKPAESAPKRISFSKGATNTVEHFDLEPGAVKKFVIGAKSGQDLTIANSGEGGKTTMLTKGKLVDVTEDANTYNATTTGGGDFIFEVSNPTKKKIKASINVIIETIGDD